MNASALETHVAELENDLRIERERVRQYEERYNALTAQVLTLERQNGILLEMRGEEYPERIAALVAQVEVLRAALGAITNLSHLAWLDEPNIAGIFERIEDRARAALTQTEQPKP